MTAGGLAGSKRARFAGARFRNGVRAAVLALAAVIMLIAAQSGSTAITSGTTYTVTNVNSGKCVDARAAATANGTAVQQYTCNGTTAQQWLFTATDSGYFRVGIAPHAAQVWDDTNVSTADSSPDPAVALRRRHQPAVAARRGGRRHLPLRQPLQRQVPGRAGASTADSVQLQQYACNGTAAQSFTVEPDRRRRRHHAGRRTRTTRPRPERQRSSTRRCRRRRSRAGSNIVFAQQETNQFGTEPLRAAVQAGHLQRRRQRRLLHPGRRPRPVARRRDHQRRRARRGRLVRAATPPRTSGARPRTCPSHPSVGHRSVGGLAGRAVPAHARAAATSSLDDNGGWSSGGFIADSEVDGQVSSGIQQQFLSRNTQLGSWTGSNWNMVFVGDTRRARAAASRARRTPRSAQTPVVAGEAVPLRRRGRRLPGLRAGAAHQLAAAPPGRAARRPARRCRSASSTSSRPATPRRPSTRRSRRARTCCSRRASTT